MGLQKYCFLGSCFYKLLNNINTEVHLYNLIYPYVVNNKKVEPPGYNFA